MSSQRQRCRSTSQRKNPSRFLIYYSLGLLVGSSVTTASGIKMYGGPLELVARQAEGQNLQQFTGTLGEAAPAVTSTGDSTRPFGVDGDTFTDFQDAEQRSCNNQFNACAQQANSNKSVNFTVGDCQNQQTACLAQQDNTHVDVQESAASSSSSSFETTTITTSSSPSTSTSTATATSIFTSDVIITTSITTTADTDTSSTSAAALAQTTITDGQFLLICDI